MTEQFASNKRVLLHLIDSTVALLSSYPTSPDPPQVVVRAPEHLLKLASRLRDTSSRVLVTGDLNSGKSTFINAILRKELLPADQMPLTSLFVEVTDVHRNNGIEEIHGIRNIDRYSHEDTQSYERIDLSQLPPLVEENTPGYSLLKLYCRDNRDGQQSLLHNGIVDISLIDSPGLNIDSLKTSALFARQEEIDVVIFVVNAENHFTLSVIICFTSSRSSRRDVNS